MKYLKLVLMITVLLLSFSLVQAVHVRSAEIQVTLISQDPDPVEPGQTVKIKFKIENTGDQSNIDNIVKIVPQFPFTLYQGQEEINIGKMEATQTGDDAIIVEYLLKVDEEAVEGDTEIELMVKSSELAWRSYTNNEFMINIQTHDAVLDITQITFHPEQVPPGKTSQIDIMVKNLADSLLKDIKFKLDFDSSTLPLAPYQSSSEGRIAHLDTNHQKSLQFQVIADPAASPGLYKIPLNISYNDEKGNSYSIEDNLALSVGETPKLKAHIKKSTVLQKNSPGKITVEIANAGTTDIKFLELYLLPSDDYQLIATTDYFYLGDVDSDDTESEEIDIFINRKTKTLQFPIQLKYYDANNKPYQQMFNLEMNLYSTFQLRKFGLAEPSKAGLYGFLLILAGVGYLIYRRRKNKKKQP